MQRLTAFIFLGCIVSGKAADSAPHPALDKSLQNIVNQLSDRVFTASPNVQNATLDEAILGKSAQMPISRTSGALKRGFPVGHGLNQHRSGRGQAGMSAVSAIGRTGAFTHHMTGSAVVSPLMGYSAHSRGARAVAQAMPETGTDFEVSQPRPTGIKWQKCVDGGIYVAALDKNADPRVQVGDKLEEVSANFGDKIWKAESYQQCMMAIKTRIGPVYMKILSRGGNTDVFTQADDRTGYEKERAGGNFGAGTEQEMRKRWEAGQATEAERKSLFEEGISNFKAGKYTEALEQFQMVKVMEPKNYIGDRFERFTIYYPYSAYNEACCYASLGEEEAGLQALKDALDGGWEDYEKIRTDDKLKFLRQSPKFQPLLDLYDEPIFNNPFKDIKMPFR